MPAPSGETIQDKRYEQYNDLVNQLKNAGELVAKIQDVENPTPKDIDAYAQAMFGNTSGPGLDPKSLSAREIIVQRQDKLNEDGTVREKGDIVLGHIAGVDWSLPRNDPKDPNRKLYVEVNFTDENGTYRTKRHVPLGMFLSWQHPDSPQAKALENRVNDDGVSYDPDNENVATPEVAQDTENRFEDKELLNKASALRYEAADKTKSVINGVDRAWGWAHNASVQPKIFVKEFMHKRATKSFQHKHDRAMRSKQIADDARASANNLRAEIDSLETNGVSGYAKKLILEQKAKKAERFAAKKEAKYDDHRAIMEEKRATMLGREKSVQQEYDAINNRRSTSEARRNGRHEEVRQAIAERVEKKSQAELKKQARKKVRAELKASDLGFRARHKANSLAKDNINTAVESGKSAEQGRTLLEAKAAARNALKANRKLTSAENMQAWRNGELTETRNTISSHFAKAEQLESHASSIGASINASKLTRAQLESELDTTPHDDATRRAELSQQLADLNVTLTEDRMTRELNLRRARELRQKALLWQRREQEILASIQQHERSTLAGARTASRETGQEAQQAQARAASSIDEFVSTITQ